MRQAIQALRRGVYENALTSDGFDEPITIRVRERSEATRC